MENRENREKPCIFLDFRCAEKAKKRNAEGENPGIIKQRTKNWAGRGDAFLSFQAEKRDRQNRRFSAYSYFRIFSSKMQEKGKELTSLSASILVFHSIPILIIPGRGKEK